MRRVQKAMQPKVSNKSHRKSSKPVPLLKQSIQESTARTYGYARRESLVGKKFNRLLVVSYAGKDPTCRNSLWNCHCDCGEAAIAVGSRLKNGSVKSCGCFRKNSSYRHGHSAGGILSPEYRSWQHMHNRCGNPKDIGYHRYGGRGIKVCKKWAAFESFLADVGLRPSAKHSLGRKNNDGDYKPGNVSWETPLQQGGNNSRNRNFTISGRTMCLSAWVRERGLVVNTVHRRLKRGQSIEVALEIKPAVDQMEREQISTRTKHGMAEKMRQGQAMGREPKVKPAMAKKMKHMRFKRRISVQDIAAKFHVSPAAVYLHTNPKKQK